MTETFTAIVVSHANERGLRSILGQLRYQTRTPDETIVLCSETPDLARLREDFCDVEFVATPNMNDWGHSKRARGVELATSDWIGFFNDDDTYDAYYLEKMLGCAAREHSDAVYCAWNEQPACDFRLTHSTAGNFIVRTKLAQAAGYPDTPVYENDGHFIERLNSLAIDVVKLDELLYHHNVQA